MVRLLARFADWVLLGVQNWQNIYLKPELASAVNLAVGVPAHQLQPEFVCFAGFEDRLVLGLHSFLHGLFVVLGVESKGLLDVGAIFDDLF